MALNAPIRLRVLPALLPVDGREIELQAGETHIQYRYAARSPFAETEWVDLAAYEQFPPGPSVELRRFNDFIQWRSQIEGSEWVNLIGIDELKGEQGDPGVTPSFTVGSVTTGVPGTPAEVLISGDETSVVLDFTIPAGAEGDPGEGIPDGGTTGQILTKSDAGVEWGDLAGAQLTVNELAGNGTVGPYPFSSPVPNGAVSFVFLSGVNQSVNAYGIGNEGIVFAEPVADGIEVQVVSLGTSEIEIGVPAPDTIDETSIKLSAAAAIRNKIGALGSDDQVTSGSNANGEWTRYPDGTQECWVRGLPATTSTSMGSFFRGAVEWTFPMPFVDSQAFVNSVADGAFRFWGGNVTAVTTTDCVLRTMSDQNLATTVAGYAIGRWK